MLSTVSIRDKLEKKSEVHSVSDDGSNLPRPVFESEQTNLQACWAVQKVENH